jgi:hypothetical protein
MWSQILRMAQGCLAVIAASSCSQAGSSAGSAPAPVTMSAQHGGTIGGTSGMTMAAGSTGQTVHVEASRDAVWAKLPAAYESLGLPLAFQDAARSRLGNDQIKARRALNGVQMRSILDCGSDLNGEKAETYDIRLTIETTVVQGETADVADVTTIVSGLGRSPSFGGSEISCSTKGELERRILRFVRAQLGLPAK